MLIKVLIVLLFTLTLSQNLPGFKIGISKRGLEYARDVGIQVLNNELKNIKIPDQKIDVKTPIGGVDFWITNFKLNALNLPNPQIGLVPSSGLSLLVQDASTNIGFNWRFRKREWPHISDSGTATISASKVKLSAHLEIVEEGGKPKVNVKSSDFSIGQFNLTLRGGASWLYNIIIGLFKGSIKRDIENEVKKEITNVINVELNTVLRSLPTNILIPDSNGVGLDYSHTAKPIFTQTYMTLQGNGEFFDWKNRTASRAPRRVLPNIVNAKHHIELLFSDFVALSAGEAFHKTQKLMVDIDDRMLPPESPIRLNTTHFALMLPALYEHFPNLLISLKLKTTQPPTAEMSENGIRVVAIGDIEWWVNFPNGTKKIAFTLGSVVTCSGKVWVEKSNLVGELSLLNIKNSLKFTAIGQFNVGLFDMLINMLFEAGIIPELNKVLAKGFPLPSIPELQLINPTVQWAKDFLIIATDVKYIPKDDKYKIHIH